MFGLLPLSVFVLFHIGEEKSTTPGAFCLVCAYAYLLEFNFALYALTKPLCGLKAGLLFAFVPLAGLELASASSILALIALLV